MKQNYPNKKIEEENNRLISMMLESEEDLSVEAFIDKYASESFKDYLKRREKRSKELYAAGIIEN